MRLLVSLALVSCMGFASTQDNFPDVPNTDWRACAALDFEACGLWPGHWASPVSLIELVQAMPEALRKRTGRRIPSELNFDQLNRMIFVWDAQLAKLGASPSELRKSVKEARAIAEEWAREKPKAVIGLPDKNFPDIQENHWAYDAFSELRKHGLILEDEVPAMFRLYRGPGSMTYREFGNGLIAAIPRIGPALDKAMLEPKVSGDLLDLPLPALKAMCQIFEKNLGDLGIGRKEMEIRLDYAMAKQRRLRSLVTGAVVPLADLPAGHWASSAVGALQGRGLLAGYPDGRFKGGHPRP